MKELWKPCRRIRKTKNLDHSSHQILTFQDMVAKFKEGKSENLGSSSNSVTKHKSFHLNL